MSHQPIHTLNNLYKKSGQYKTLLHFMIVIITLIVLAPIIANDRPLICKYKNNLLFPAFSTNHQLKISDSEIINYNMGKDWKILQTDFIFFPLCAYSPKTIDAENPYKSPFSYQQIKFSNSQLAAIPFKFRHWLGTTQNGTDVLSAIIHGTKNSISIGFWSMLCAGVIGILLGAMAGYFGNHTFKLGLIQLTLMLLTVLLCIFYSSLCINDYAPTLSFNGLIVLLLLLSSSVLFMFASSSLGKWIEEKIHLQKQYAIPLDTIISKWIEVLSSIPSLLIIIAITSVAKPSLSLLILVIGFLSATSVARIVRAEYLVAKELNYVLAYKAMGLKNSSIIFTKILPNIFPILLVQLLFVMMGAIIIEASLSFIGIGIPNNSISWGSIIAEARENFSAWWLVIFPGCCIFLVLYYCYKIKLSFSKNR